MRSSYACISDPVRSMSTLSDGTTTMVCSSLLKQEMDFQSGTSFR